MRKTVVIVKAFDDLHLAEERTEVPAEETVVIGLEGQWYELDLTREHAGELRLALKRYTEAGNPPAQEPRRRGKKSAKRYPLPGSTLNEARAFGRQLRDWADEHGRTGEYLTPGGSYNPKKPLLDDYRAYLAREAQAVHSLGDR